MPNKRYSFNQPITKAELVRTAKDAVVNEIRDQPVFSNPHAVRDFLVLELAHLEIEVFYVLFLNSQHRLIKKQKLFQGTIDGAAVYPREVARHAIKQNAAAVILAHNHPSGSPEPSAADKRITQRLKEALALLDIRVLDHLVVGGDRVVSFAEEGFL